MITPAVKSTFTVSAGKQIINSFAYLKTLFIFVLIPEHNRLCWGATGQDKGGALYRRTPAHLNQSGFLC